MMGRTHALSGAAAWGIAAIPASPLVGLHPRELLLGTAVCAGAAVLPDIDHPGSGISRTLGPLTRGCAWAVARASGGHRRGTHSLVGAAAVALTAFGATGLYTANPWWGVVGVAAAAVLAGAGALVAAAGRRGRGNPRAGLPSRRAAALTGLVSAAGLTAAAAWPHQTGLAVLAVLLVLVLSAVARLVPTRRLFGLRREWDDLLPVPVTALLIVSGADLRVVPVAVVLGVVVHIAGDMVTLGGCPLGWPWSGAMRGPKWFRTNSPVEMGPVTWVFGGLVVAAAGWHIGLLAPL